MKDAASEANMTVLAIILIAVIAAVVTPIIKNAMDTTQKKSECLTNGGTWEGNACVGAEIGS